jgi:undecaprenyl-phosphate 4-deoxy-4-formamido-L-arabinose transferase
VFNEEATLEALYARLAPVLGGISRSHEVLFVNDGSRDASLGILRRLHELHPVVRVIALNRNYGQHAAVFAGLEYARGEIIVTLDADLQNPPEEIPRLVAEVEAGHDVVGGWRRDRQDPLLRRLLSRCMNRLTSYMVGVRMRDYGCMLRAYRREVVDVLRGCREISSFVPALANSFARSPAEIAVEHAGRTGGRSRYHLFRLIRLAFDLMTGFSLIPIQVVSLAGIGIALLGLGFGGFLLVRRLWVGPEVEGVFTLFAILFVFVGVQILALGLIGEYIGRIYLEVRRRPRYVIQEVYDHAPATTFGPTGERADPRGA